MGGGGGGGDGEPEFQIAPMIDVLLVLLIFFMSITSAQVLSIDKEIQLPVAKDAKKKEKDVQNEANLNVRWTNGKATILFENTAYDVVDPLVEKLRARHDAVVVQVAERGVDEGVVVRAHAQGAVRAVVVGLALALVVVAAEAL